MKSRGRAGWWPVVITTVIILAVLIYWPVLRWMVNSWLSSDYYSHGFLVPLISAFFIWARRKEIGPAEPSAYGYIMMIGAVIVYFAGFFWQIKELSAFSLVLLIAGLVLAIRGVKAARVMLFPLVFLLFMIPFRFIQDLAYELQYLSVHWAAGLTKLLGLPVVTSGTEIHMGSITFTVGIVCSGINTLVALLALAAVYVYILNGSPGKRTGLFILAIPIAIGANILRISSIIGVAYFTDVQTATGWYHDLSSPLFFFLAFGLLALIAWACKFRFNYSVLGTSQPVQRK